MTGTWIVVLATILGLDMLYPELIFATIALAIPILIGAIWIHQSGGAWQEIAPMKKFPVQLIPFCILLPIMVQQLASYSMMPINAWFSVLFGQAQENLVTPDSVGTFILAFLGLCVVAPLFEEVLCRGVILRLLQPYGFVISVMVSAGLFTALHMEVQSMIPIFLLGVLFGVARYATGSILSCILMHAANNFLAMLLMMLSETAWGGTVGIIFSVLMAVLCPLALWQFFRLLGTDWKQNLQMHSTVPVGMSVGMMILVVLVAVFNLAIIIGRLFDGAITAELQQWIPEF